MIGRSHGAGSTVPPLSHAQAEGLISARLDVPLDPRQEQMLAAHLSSCVPCRHFANQMDLMRTGFRAIPHLPASPIVSRQVRERIAQPRSIWDRIGALFGGRGALAPMAASASLIALVIVTYVIFADSGGDGRRASTITAGTGITVTATDATNAYLAPGATDEAPSRDITPGSVVTPSSEATRVLDVRAPTEEPTRETGLAEEPTATPEPSATPELTATERPTRVPTETEEPTATREPTEEPTAAEEPTREPTATERPTRTPTEEPTSTVEPTSTEEPTEEPTATEEPTETPTDEPTATERSTETPTEEPTATEEPTEEPTATVEPTEAGAPTIEPIGGDDPVTEEVVELEPTVDESAAVEPVDEATEVIEDDSAGTTQIEPLVTPDDEGGDRGDGQGGSDETGPGDNTGSAGSGGAALDDTGRITGLAESGGAPLGPLRINAPGSLMVLSSDSDGGNLQVVSTGDGSVYANLGPGANPIWSPLGIVLLYQDNSGGTPAAALYDSETGEIRRISDPDADGAIQDIPAGWSGTGAYFLRQYTDGTATLFGYDVNTGDTFTVWEGGELALADARPIPTGDGFLIATQSQWLRIGADGSQADLGPNERGITGEGFLSPFGTLVAYPAGGSIIIASVESPGVPIGQTIPYVVGLGAGFTWSPDGSWLAVSDGFSIQIYDYQGTFLSAATSDNGATIAAPQWLEDGIYYVETYPTPSLRRLITDKIPGFGA